MMYFAPQFGQSKVIGSGLLGRQLAGICALIFLAMPVSEIDLYQAELQKIACLTALGAPQVHASVARPRLGVNIAKVPRYRLKRAISTLA
jgi:hypothetical protein